MRWFSMAAVAALLSPQIALAWNKAGHMLTGAIAYAQLEQSDPTALQEVLKILKEHPEFDSRWAPQLAQFQSQADKDLYLFMLAARWPDDVRGDPDFHHEQWHYINHPFKPSNQPASVQTAPPAVINIVAGFLENAKIAQTSGDAEDKAVALCWIFHLLGDAHQPLHSSTLFTTQFPQGDRGGTRFYIRATAGARTIGLHKHWDDAVIGSERLRSVRNRANALAAQPQHARTALPELAQKQFDKWIKPESFDLARQVAYRNGSLSGSTNENNGRVLPNNYAGQVKPVAEKRAVLAGYRLADLMGEWF